MNKLKGFKAFDGLMRKLAKVPPSELEQGSLSKAQHDVLLRLMGGWTLDKWGRDGMQGYMVRGRDEHCRVTAKTMGSLIRDGLIRTGSVPSVTEFEITTHGKAALSWKKPK